jgi:hypothetical protein
VSTSQRHNPNQEEEYIKDGSLKSIRDMLMRFKTFDHTTSASMAPNFELQNESGSTETLSPHFFSGSIKKEARSP